MEDKDYIKDLFSDKLTQFESSVRPELWSGISSQLGNAAATGVTGLTIAAKVLIGLSVASTIAFSVYILRDENEDNSTQLKPAKKEKVVTESMNNGEEAINNDQLNEKLVQTENSEDEVKEAPVQNNGDGVQYTDQTGDQVKDVLVQHAQQQLPYDNDRVLEEKSVIQQQNSSPAVENAATTETMVSENLIIEPAIELPNTFTPNGDGINDLLFIEGIEDVNLADFHLIVLDAQNKVVYQTSDTQFSWNGDMLSGGPVAEGNYIYYFTAKDADGKAVTKYSRLTIKR